MKIINLYRVTVSPAAIRIAAVSTTVDSRPRAFLTNPTKAELLEAIAHSATELKAQLDQVSKDDDDEFEIDIEDIKRKLENLALVLEILNAWHPEPHSIDHGNPIAIQVAHVNIGVIKFESETVFDVRVSSRRCGRSSVGKSTGL
jgi:hypothetical protein